jgi:hypothetical protein
MIKRLLTSCAVVALYFGTAPAQAEVNMISHSGFWYTYSGTNDQGYPQCATIMSGKLEGGLAEEASVMFKFDSHLPGGIGIEITKETWNIPENAQMKVALQIDNARALYFTANRGHDQKQIRILLPFTDTDSVTGENSIKELTDLLTAGVKLTIWFPNGNERQWTVPLGGTATELQNFKTCTATILTARNQPSQPYGQTQTTQPTQPNKPQELPTTTQTQPYKNL